MQPHSIDSIRKAIKAVAVAGFAAALAVFFYPLYADKLPLVPPWIAVKARENAPLVQVGMTEAQVWSTLGLSGRGLRAHVSGSGPPEAYPANYGLWPGYVVHARWNLKTHPATVVQFRFQDRL